MLLFSLLFLIITIIVIYMIVKLFFIQQKEQTYIEKYINFEAPALGHAASCVDCENQFQSQQKWMGQPSKCFSCERDMQRRHGDEAVFMATKQKCFDC